VQTGQPWGIHQGHHLRFLTPDIIGRFGISKPDAEDTVAGNSPFVENRQHFALFGREAFHRITIQSSDARHGVYPP
jgi:hypothetical protein